MDRRLPRDEDGLAPDRRVTEVDATKAKAAEAAAPEPLTEPLTERILDWLGEPKWAWILVWTAVSFLRPVILFVALSGGGRHLSSDEWIRVLVIQASFAWVTLVGFFGVRYIWRGVRGLAADLATLAPGESVARLFAGMASTFGPILLTVAIVVVPSFVSSWQHWGAVAALSDLPLVFINSLPSMTFIWMYLVLLTGFQRLGHARLSLDSFPEDRSLGLGPVGSLALNGFWLVLVAAIPLIIVGSADLPTVVLSLGVIAASVALFFLSMYRIHRQMVDTKRGYLSLARGIYGEAYKPVRTKPSLKALQDQAPVLNVAQALVERAEHILEWPIDERATAWVVVVITGVVTSLIVRLVLALAGA
jgi:hypothetical protein